MPSAVAVYQYSLTWFKQLFVDGIRKAPTSDDIDTRITHLNEFITYLLYTNVCRSIFEVHKLMFSFLLAIKIQMGAGKIDLAEWRFLLSGGKLADGMPKPDASWITQSGTCKTTSNQDCSNTYTIPSNNKPLDSAKSTPFWANGITGSGQIVQVSDSGLDADNQYFWDSDCEVAKTSAGPILPSGRPQSAESTSKALLSSDSCAEEKESGLGATRGPSDGDCCCWRMEPRLPPGPAWRCSTS